jgi:DNA-binding CsgD family transcriptional regulator
MRKAFELDRTPDVDGLLRVVDRVYAAGCAETLWHQPLDELCRVGNFGGCALTSVDPPKQGAIIRASHGLRARASGGAGAIRVPRNPLLTDDVLRSPAGAIWHDQRLMSPELSATTPFWPPWMQADGFVSWICVVVDREDREVVCLEVFLRPRGASSHRTAVDLLARLAPHLTRAWRHAKAAQRIPQQGADLAAGAPPSAAQPPASPSSQVTAAIVQLRAAFGLSKAEARLALHLSAGASLASMAKAFDVKLSTIRSQLQQVFEKTGTTRQAELVALLLNHGYVGSNEPVSQSAWGRASYSIAAL